MTTAQFAPVRLGVEGGRDSDAVRTTGRSREIPADILREAASRLGTMSGVAAVLWTSAYLIARHVSREYRPNAIWGSDVTAAASVAMSLGLLFYTRRSRRWPKFLLDLGPASNAFIMHYANFLCAGVAVVISHVITGLRRQVSRARELGSYRLEGLIGAGGMGEVYHATHRLLARPAAVKLIRPEVLERRSPERARVVVERFRREAEAAATLRSAHTIELYDFGVSDEGVFYYVMELLDGIDLEQLVERFGPLPPERVIHLLRQACDSLAEAHTRGLMHRDIKPSNIHTCRKGLTVDFVKVLDFGLVKPQPGRNSNELKLTAPDANTPGTPAFMAPEAVVGDPATDHRADIYALGCVGYWLLTGKLVFEAASAGRMLLHHVETPPEPPSRRSSVAIPLELDAVILACLAKRAADRPSSAPELADRLAACPVREAWTEERARDWWADHLPAGANHQARDEATDFHVDFQPPPHAR